MKAVVTTKAPAPIGHYSQGIVHNGLVYVSGQLAIDPRTRQRVGDTIEAQAEQALKNVSAVLVAAGSDINHVLKCTVYLCNMEDGPKVNQIYGAFFGEHRPARATIPIKDLPNGYLIEIDAIGVVVREEA